MRGCCARCPAVSESCHPIRVPLAVRCEAGHPRRLSCGGTGGASRWCIAAQGCTRREGPRQTDRGQPSCRDGANSRADRRIRGWLPTILWYADWPGSRVRQRPKRVSSRPAIVRPNQCPTAERFRTNKPSTVGVRLSRWRRSRSTCPNLSRTPGSRKPIRPGDDQASFEWTVRIRASGTHLEVGFGRTCTHRLSRASTQTSGCQPTTPAFRAYRTFARGLHERRATQRGGGKEESPPSLCRFSPTPRPTPHAPLPAPPRLPDPAQAASRRHFLPSEPKVGGPVGRSDRYGLISTRRFLRRPW